MALQQDLQKRKNNELKKMKKTALQAGKQESGNTLTLHEAVVDKEDIAIDAVLQQAGIKVTTEQIGLHYTKAMNPGKIRDLKQLEGNIKAIIKREKGLVLSGPVGVGKTIDLVYIMRRIINGTMKDYARWLMQTTRNDTEASTDMIVHRVERIVSYHFAPTLFNQLHEAKEIKITPFFIIDDLGRQYNEPFAVSRFEAIVEEMYRTERTLIITTNLSRDELLSIAGWGRITDRIREMCNFMRIPGNSMRHK